MEKIIKIFWLCAGFILLTLGFIGIFLPILPVIPFFLLASACFFKGSRRIYKLFQKFILKNRFYNKYLKKYWENPKTFFKIKIFFIVCSWISASFSSYFILNSNIHRMGAFVVALSITFYILTIKPSGSTKNNNSL